jgi:type VI secretion system protein ImpL
MTMPAWMRNRWTLGALALAAFSLVVWFVGDTLVLGSSRPLEAPWQRLALAALAAAAWIGWELARAARARKENERLLAIIAGGEEETDSGVRAAHEVALLRQRFEKAAAVLKTARFQGPDGEKRYVHELPWYVIIGAPGSGKTTALVNSGLKFPLPGSGAEPGIAGVGGTRNCDWWFTDEAVLLDTAGRYTTQQSDAVADASAWLGFLDLLKRFRPRRPLNGALVTVSVSDLMLWGEDERARYAAHVRERIAELYQRLGVRFPVYLLVTKADLLAGFMEFFGELDAGARAQVWGATFDLAAARSGGEGPGSRFAFEFGELEQRLGAELRSRLQEESDLQRRAAIYRFPQEFHGVGPRLERFIEAVFAGQPSAPLVRGVYFTSGTQEGSPIDRVLGTLARGFKLERAAAVASSGTGKSFFLTTLVRQVIFPESGLAGSDASIERRQRQMRLAAYAAIAAVAVALGALWSGLYFDNRERIAATLVKADAAKAALDKAGPIGPGEEARLVAVLDALRDVPGARAAPAGEAAGFGLSQAGKLGSQAARAYRNALSDALLPRLALSLEDDLREKIRNPKARNGLEQSLAAYESLYEAKKPEPAALEAAARRVWRLPEAARAALAAHLDAGVGEGAPEVRHPRDEAIIKAARQLLGTGKTS